MQKYLFNVDWVAWSLTEVAPKFGEGEEPVFRFRGSDLIVKQFDGTNVWSRRYIIFLADGGAKIATLLCYPKSSLFDEGSGLLEVANEWLYHGLGWKGVMDACWEVFDFRPHGLARVDLCFDFVPTADQCGVITDLATNKAYVAGKRAGSGFWSIDAAAPSPWAGVKCPHCQSWGHKTSSIRWKLYYKSKELADNGYGWNAMDKQYIVDQWRQCEFDPKRVWRLEVSCRYSRQFVSEYGYLLPIDFDRLQAERVAGMLAASRFKVRRTEGHAKHGNDTPIEVFADLLKPVNTIRLRSRDEDASSRELETAMLSECYRRAEKVADGTGGVAIDVLHRYAADIVAKFRLGAYWERMAGETIDDFFSRKRFNTEKTVT